MSMAAMEQLSWRSVSESGTDGLLDVSVNTNPLGVPPAVEEGLRRLPAFPGGYPDPDCQALRESLGEKYGVAPEQILCGSGADDLLYRLVLACQPRRAVIVEPTFEEYARALTLAGCEVCHYDAGEAAEFRLKEGVLDALEEDCDMIFLCNPNNPTGQLAELPLLEKIAERCRQKGILLVVDECFMEFLPDWERHTLKGQAARASHLLVLDALTKTYGLAAFRLGFCICGDRELLARMAAWGQSFGVSAPAQLAGLYALADGDYMARARGLVEEERRWLMAALKELPVKVCPSRANFLLLKTGEGALRQKLLERGVKVRDCSRFYGLDGTYCRVAIRTRAENEALLEALRAVLS